MNLIFHLSTRIEVYLYCEMPTNPLCETRTEGSKLSEIYLTFYSLYRVTEVCLSGGKPAPTPNLTTCFTEANFISVYMGL
jgi:hypothetical protein